MRVILLGGTGLIGRSLVALLPEHGHEVVVVSRDPDAATQKFEKHRLANLHIVGWDGRTAQSWGAWINQESAIINLAGATPAHWRWTKAYKTRILESRLHAGQAIMRAMECYGIPKVLVQASASGYYGDRGQELLTEASLPGQGFRARVCQEWEASTAHALTRRCIVRMGLVFDTKAGAFPPFLRFAQLSGSRLGDGKQWVPWIHNRDVASAILFLLEHPLLSGPFNLCAPEAVTNGEFLRSMQQVSKRFAVFPLPTPALRVLLGELATVVLDSQHLVPQRLMEASFQFKYPHLEQALHNLLREKDLFTVTDEQR